MTFNIKIKINRGHVNKLRNFCQDSKPSCFKAQKEAGIPTILKTPATCKRKSVAVSRRSTFSAVATTSSRKSMAVVSTPSMQKRAASKIDQTSDALSVYEKARIKLHVANTPDCLPCRDKQFSDIFNFIETNLKNQTGGYFLSTL